MSHIEIVDVVLPSTIGQATDDFLEAIRVYSDAHARTLGTDDVRVRPADVVAWWRDPGERHHLLAARVDGRVVGMGEFAHYTDDETGSVWFDAEADPGPDHDRVLDAIATRLDELARQAGARRIGVYQPSPAGSGARLAPPTGAGSVPADDPKVRWWRDRGFRLEQVERVSRFELPPDRATLARFRRDAEGATPDYREHRWIDVTPERRRDDMAVLMTRMTTDAPSAGMEEPESVWTAQRVVDAESGRTPADPELLTVVVEHMPTGRLAGFTRLSVPRDPGDAVSQAETLVLREHRGHRLGMRLKVAGLEFLDEARPGHPSIVTWNAEENRHMLDVNEAVGFVAIGSVGAWRKDLG